jgi:hypothetical protein
LIAVWNREPRLLAFQTAAASLLFVFHLRFREVERDFAAFGILYGFQIADLGFALGFWFFLCLRPLVHMGICVDCCCFGCACSEMYCPKSGARLRGKFWRTAEALKR